MREVRVFPAIGEVCHVVTGTDSLKQPAEEREPTTAFASSAAITSAIYLCEALAVRGDES